MYSLITDSPPTERDNWMLEVLGATDGETVRAAILIQLTDNPDDPYIASTYKVTANDWAAVSGYCSLEAAASLIGE